MTYHLILKMRMHLIQPISWIKLRVEPGNDLTQVANHIFHSPPLILKTRVNFFRLHFQVISCPDQ